MVCFFAVVGGIGYLAAFSLNLLPPSTYVYVYQTFWIQSPRSTYPYLTKFQGHWLSEFSPAIRQSSLSDCKYSTTTLAIDDGHVTGILDPIRHIGISALVSEEGILVGKTITGAGNYGVIEATLYKSEGKGTWTDALDCHGTVVMKKLEPYEDPSKGFIVSYTGDVTLKRSEGSQPPRPGQSLYARDEITVPQNGTAFLSIGSETISVRGGAQYIVPP